MSKREKVFKYTHTHTHRRKRERGEREKRKERGGPLIFSCALSVTLSVKVCKLLKAIPLLEVAGSQS